MKVIDCSAKTSGNGNASQLVEQFKQFLLGSNPAQGDRVAQGVVIELFSKVLGKNFVMLRNVSLEGLEYPIPLLLISQGGIYVINPTSVKGIYRAKYESWYELKGKESQLVRARPNLVQMTVEMTAAVEKVLREKGRESVDLQGVLIFTSPATHVDNVRAAVRIVLVDAIEPFMASLVQGGEVMTSIEVQNLASLFYQPQIPVEVASKQLRDSFDFIEESKPRKPVEIKTPEFSTPPILAKNMQVISRQFRLTTKQWVFLGALAILNILLLMGVIVFILLTI